MVTPRYAQKRSVLAKQIGLSRKGEGAAEARTAEDVPEGQHLPQRKRGRKNS